MMSAQVPVTPQLLLTTPFVLAQSHDPVGQEGCRKEKYDEGGRGNEKLELSRASFDGVGWISPPSRRNREYLL